jgi:hydroxymethylpyrimidine pyrophosphatase-like HAD family hydrolase
MNAHKTIRLLIADVDGTLVTHDKVLTGSARAAVGKMRSIGIEFAITSGRPPRGMQMVIEPLALTTPIAAFNGGMFYQIGSLGYRTTGVEGMGQASDEVKSVATHTTSSSEEEGFANAVERYVLQAVSL